MRSLALALERAWYAPPRLLWLLFPLELVFAAVTALRRQLFRSGFLRSGHPGCPVIVVGNLTAGGSSKTPIVLALARELAARGICPGVVSRGYGGQTREVLRVDQHSDPRTVGDEALLLARGQPGPVVVGRDRLAAACKAREAGAEVVISDDGLQHYRLRRDIEIVAMDVTVGLGNGHLLPVGPLREGAGRTKRADFVLELGGACAARRIEYRPLGLRRLTDLEVRPLESLDVERRIHAFAAIARPGRFFRTLRDLGFEPEEHALVDHQFPSESFITRLADRPLVMTAKDAVKFPLGAHPDAWVLEMDLTLPEGFVDRLIDRLPLPEEPAL